MIITLSPIRSDAALTLHRAGDVLTVNGVAYDLSPLVDGATLPAAALGCPDVVGDVVRQASLLRLSIALPHGLDAPDEARFPAPLDPVPEGPVDLPGHPWTGNGVDANGVIDWAQMVTPEMRQAAELDAWRQTATLNRPQFLAALIGFGLVTTQEAVAMGSGGIPALLADAVAAMPEPPKNMVLMLMATAQRFDRVDPYLSGLGDAMGWTVEQRDALFGWVVG